MAHTRRDRSNAKEASQGTREVRIQKRNDEGIRQEVNYEKDDYEEDGQEEMKKAKGAKKVAKVMREFKGGKLHSGSKKGPVVKSRKQAVAIALSEAGMAKKAKKK
jgi:hypothetical protein